MAAAAAADGVNAPFDPLLLPFADRGGAELEAEERQALAVFSPEARATIDRALVQFLSQLAAPALREHAALRRFPWESDDRAASADEVVEVLHEYPLLAELLAAWAQRSACAHAELAGRVQREWPGLRVDAIAPYQSDPHDGGRTVATLALCDGSSAVSTVVYKPRSVEMEHAFGDLLTWANARQFPWPFRRVEVMPRDGYGWMERVATAPCETRQEVEAFFARAGGLLAFAALLQGTDLHHENLIAARD
ncbi:MAG TPA: DUF4135 domain-containing protein, partial [Thermoanaerobaculia bacterium]|nr:DUF4135 domain-containing protein [Thermoanaerobaculia bacterium]